jgi:hypothetical protein
MAAGSCLTGTLFEKPACSIDSRAAVVIQAENLQFLPHVLPHVQPNVQPNAMNIIQRLILEVKL